MKFKGKLSLKIRTSKEKIKLNNLSVTTMTLEILRHFSSIKLP